MPLLLALAKQKTSSKMRLYSNWVLSRLAERELYNENPRSALVKLNNDNLSFPIYDWLFSVLFFSFYIQILNQVVDYRGTI